jgi:hypothetical protein
MSTHLVNRTDRRPSGVTVIAVVNALAMAVTVLFWGLVLILRLVPPPGGLPDIAARANAATTYGFLFGDLLWSTPLLALAAVGVWRLRPWGWTAAQMANVLWVYSMTVIWVRDGYTTPSPGGLLFLPFTVFAFWATYYLWRTRHLFWGQDRSE